MKTDAIERLMMLAVNDYATAYAIVWLEEGKVVTAAELGDSEAIDVATMLGGVESLKFRLLRNTSYAEDEA